MQKKVRFVLTMVLVAIGLYGCQSRNINIGNRVENMSSENRQYQDDMAFMIEHYGISEEALQDIDLNQFMEDYQLKIRDYTTEEILEILSEEGDIYLIDDNKRLFAILQEEEGGTLEENTEIQCIGYYRNEGTRIQKAIFDLEKKTFYVDGVNANILTNEQFETLKELPSKYEIAKWNNYYECDEQESTGSFRWKLVFVLENGQTCVYGGYTGDMSNLPESFLEVNKELMAIMKTVK